MFPIPARVILPAVVSLVSALWALAEWAGNRAELVGADLDPEREQRQAAADDRAERALRLAESREARLDRQQRPSAPGA